jgi:putative transposase
MRTLKQRVSHFLRSSHAQRVRASSSLTRYRSFWQHRFYDFNVWSRKKRNEKLHYMHMNPVERGLVQDPKDWTWSSCRFYMRVGTVLLSLDCGP